MDTTDKRWSREARGVLAALFCIVVWAVNYPAMKIAFRELEPLAYTGWRFLIATSTLLVLCAVRRESPIPPAGSRALGLALALSGIGVYQLFYSLGVAQTTGFSAALLNTVSPLISLALVAALGFERLSVFTVVGSLLAYAGVALFVMSTRASDPGTLSGNLLCLGSATSWAIYGVVSSRVARRMSPLTSQTATFAFGTGILLLYCGPAMLRQDYARVGLLSYTILVLSAILPLVLAFRAWALAIGALGVTTATSFGFLIPVIAGFSSALFTGETFDRRKILSAAVVLAGLAVTRMRRDQSSSRPGSGGGGASS